MWDQKYTGMCNPHLISSGTSADMLGLRLGRWRHRCGYSRHGLAEKGTGAEVLDVGLDVRGLGPDISVVGSDIRAPVRKYLTEIRHERPGADILNVGVSCESNGAEVLDVGLVGSSSIKCQPHVAPDNEM